MDKALALRWTLLSAALAGTVAAIFYPVDEEVPIAGVKTARASRTAALVQASAATVDSVAPASWIAADADPFASKGWQPPPAVEPSRPIQQAVAPVDAPPPPPLPLPFKFVGQMNDGADRVLYLANGDQVLLARLDDVLDGGYKVSAISATQIEFESVSSGLKQSLAIPAKDN